ncbi:holin-associated N-acetylmuramidase [uncultured Lentibacter sp.]|jgi:lysozyme family protein|uniref:holin-associated N-acetylmuramidase n=1 Tax=uncultured Lentibacter sp. TaxID=1659309 RepID=UPI00262723E4|nr:holin-associated N-acetylmuramidase [uncultured Lentibacter sp.]
MKTVEEIAREIVAREGGFVDDPDDLGGATNFGVTLKTLRHLGLDLTRDGHIDVADVLALNQQDAVDIFIKHYFYAPQIHELPTALQATVFDMYVNAGRNAISILQDVLGQMGYPLTRDGILGPATRAAAQDAARKGAARLVDAYGIARREYYFRIADRRAQNRKFARTRRGTKGGWILRAEEFISPAYHLTPEEFSDRTASWA